MARGSDGLYPFQLGDGKLFVSWKRSEKVMVHLTDATHFDGVSYAAGR